MLHIAEGCILRRRWRGLHGADADQRLDKLVGDRQFGREGGQWDRAVPGVISSQGTNAFPFVLPVGLRPAKRVYLPVKMCVNTNGRLIIDRDGTATLDAESDFDNARCGTSLEGVSFHQ